MKTPALASLAVQLAVVMPVSLVLAIVHPVTAYSYGLGAAIYILPNTYFTYYAFRFYGAHSAAWIAKSFKWGESGKFALVVVGFAVVLRFVSPLHIAPLFAGFCTMIATQFIVANFIQKRWIKQFSGV